MPKILENMVVLLFIIFNRNIRFIDQQEALDKKGCHVLAKLARLTYSVQSLP